MPSRIPHQPVGITHLWLMLICLLFVTLSTQGLAQVQRRTVHTGVHALSALPDSTGIFLGDEVLVNGSVQVRMDTLDLVEGRNFRVNYLTNRLHIGPDADPTKRYWVTWRSLPIPHRDYVWLDRPPVISLDSVDVTQTVPRSPLLPATLAPSMGKGGSDLRIAGSKTFSVDVGNRRDLSLEQSLRLSITGTIAQNVEVVAVLSDQNLPIHPEGNTENLRELDKVLVKLSTPHYSVTLGDYELVHDRTEFGAYRRRLEGAAATADYNSFDAGIAFAASDGVFHTMQILVIDGNRGPYALEDDKGTPGVVVLAGTERIWIDGRPLRRGENNDYIMDYSAGEITFTRKRLITDDMRITADYEFANGAYARASSTADARIDILGGRAQVGLTLIEERDQSGQPLFFTLDPDSKALLEAAGDDPAAASADGWVQDSLGSYDLIGSVFEYVGINSGSYSVFFSRVGPGKGNYVRDFLRQGIVYKYVGDGLGTHVPRRLLPLPSGHRLGVVDLRISPATWLHARGEVALSDVDNNTLSAADDGDNRRGAAKFLIIADEIESLTMGTFKGRLEGRLVERGFSPMGRTRNSEEARRWGLSLSSLQNEEKSLRGQITYAPFQWLNLTPDVGWLRRGSFPNPSSFRSWRFGGAINMSSEKGSRVRVSGEKISTEAIFAENLISSGQTVRSDLNASIIVGAVKPVLRSEYERSTSTEESGGRTGNRYLETEGGVSSVGWNYLSASASVESRVDQELAASTDGWQISRRALTQRFNTALREWAGFDVTGQYTRRRKQKSRESLTGGESGVVDVAELDLHHSSSDKAVVNRLRYRVSSNRTEAFVRLYIYVGPGDGAYAPLVEGNRALILYDQDVFQVSSGDPLGAYTPRFDPVGDFAETVELDASWRLTTNLAKLNLLKPPVRVRGEPLQKQPLWIRMLRVISTETSIRVTEIDSTRNTDLYLARFWKFRRFGISPTVRGMLDLRQDIHFWRSSPKGAWRFRLRSLESYATEIVSLTSGPEITRRNELEVRRRSRHFNRRLEWQANFRHLRQSATGTRFDYRATLDETEHTLSYHPSRSWELELSGTGGYAQDPEPSAALVRLPESPLTVAYVGLSPSTRYSWARKGQLRLKGEWLGVFPRNLLPGRSLPVRLLEGKNDGQNWRWSANIDYRLSTYLVAQITYSGWKTPGRRTVHQARSELRATF